ncbi:MAG TPA: hypothetical protein VMD27_11115 [Candidatus Aquilonibacter sp.]|nr:hypothetical protein [Candidatus Aquilonibacter sp.]
MQTFFARVAVAVLFYHLAINSATAQNATANDWKTGSAWLTAGNWALGHPATNNEVAQFTNTSAQVVGIQAATTVRWISMAKTNNSPDFIRRPPRPTQSPIPAAPHARSPSRATALSVAPRQASFPAGWD